MSLPCPANQEAYAQLKKAFPSLTLDGDRFVLRGQRFGLKSVRGHGWHGERAPVGHYLLPNPDDYSHTDWFSHIHDEASLKHWLSAPKRPPASFWRWLLSPFNPLDHEQTK